MSKKSKRAARRLQLKQTVAAAAALQVTPSTFSSVEKPLSPEPILQNLDAVQKEQGLTLGELQGRARTVQEAKQWTELLEISRTSLELIRPSDQGAARTWLLWIRVASLTEGTLQPPPWSQADRREELTAALRELAALVPEFYRTQEFWLYLYCIGHDLRGVVEGFQQLRRACDALIDLDLVRELRNRGLNLLQRDRYFSGVESKEEQQLLDSISDADIVLAEAYDRLVADRQLDSWQEVEIKACQIELQSLTAEPWDYAHVSEAIRRLSTPVNAHLRQLTAQFTQNSSQVELRTPQIWAFLWDLSTTPASGWNKLTRQYGHDLGCDWVDALALVLRSFFVPPDLADSLLGKAVQLLSNYIRSSLQRKHIGLVVILEGTTNAVWTVPPLRMPGVDRLLLRLAENVPEDYERREELLTLYRAFNAASNFELLVDEPADESMPGFSWLCQQSLPFAFEAARVLKTYPSRINLLLASLRRALDCGEQPPYAYFANDALKTEEPVNGEEGRRILDNISALAGSRQQFAGNVKCVWQHIVGPLFQSLIDLPELRQALLAAARKFETDLLEAKKDFLLGYLEQVEGDKDEALRHYLGHMEITPGPWNTAIANSKLLWSKSNDLEEVQSLVELLQYDHDRDLPHKALLAQLLTDAKAREKTLVKDQQFERTAVNRWPSLTAPARKLLGVLSTIQSYNGYKELGEYAGMSADWAERHYDKLIELGMVLLSDKGYRINPYIAPLLERESQHAVVGRIVRTQGTSAVKQVFNSQREFSIYQVMLQLCPNHLVFPNCSLQSIMSYEKLKELVSDDDFGYYLRASVDLVIVSSTTYLPMLAIEVDSVWHDTERQQRNDEKKDRIFGVSGIPFLRLRPVGSPSADTVRVQVSEHFGELVRSLRTDLPGYDQAMGLLEDLSRRSASSLSTT